MKMTTDKHTLIKHLGQVQGIAERRNTIPILANALIAVSGGTATITATDMELALVTTMPVQDGQDGAVTVPAATLYDIVRRLPDGTPITMASDAGGMSLSAGRFATRLNVLPADEFPSMTCGELPTRFDLPAADLRALMARTSFAMSTEETRFYLNGIFLHASERDGSATLRAVATDGHRLARADVALPEGAANMPSVIVPRKAVRELSKLIEGSKEVSVALSDTRIIVDVDGSRLVSKLVDGTFPEYQRVIPQANERLVSIAKRDLVDAVARVGAISNERTRPVALSIRRNAMSLSMTSTELGNASEDLDEGQVAYEGADITVGFQARYINDIADHIDGRMELRIGDPTSPAVIVEQGRADTLFVLMPIRI